MARAGRLLSHLQNGRVQIICACLGAALVVLTVLLLWGTADDRSLAHIVFPLVGGLVVLALAASRDLARVMAVVFATGSLVLAGLSWYALNPAHPGMQFEEWHAWAPSLGIW